MSAIAQPVATVAQPSHVQWSAVVAGAIAAASVSFTLHAFAAAVGLSVLSAAPTWRDSSAWLWLLTGLYFLFASLSAFGIGGYIAGRLRAPLNLATNELEFRDGMHGLIAWALAVVIAAVLALGVAAAGSAAMSPADGSAGAAQAVAGETIIAADLDELLRSDRNPTDLAYRRAEAARILLKSASHAGIGDDDRHYLAVIVANVSGLSTDAAEARVDRVIAEVTQDLHRARIAAVLQAFFIGAALLVGAAVAWYSACEGGKDREQGEFPGWHRSHRRPVKP